jgi:hypothetical protein
MAHFFAKPSTGCPMKRLNSRPFPPEGPQIEDFVERDNIAHYGDRLKTAADPFTRLILCV